MSDRTIVRKSNCIAVHENGCVVGTFAGPDCEKHAAQFVAAAAPPSSTDLRLKVCLLDGHEPFVFWVHGMATAYVLSKIDAELTVNMDDIFKDGQGDYEFTATHFDGQYGFEGRCELAPGWEFEQTGFQSLEAALIAAEIDKATASAGEGGKA